ncbi:MAG: AAA family ATPase, partial [Infirmifilum sp.]
LIYVPPPDERARLEIFKVHTRRMPLAEDVDLAELARKTEGYTGADIAAVCREAAITALREAGKPTKVTMKHFQKALDAVKPSVTKEDLEKYRRIAEEFRKMLS